MIFWCFILAVLIIGAITFFIIARNTYEDWADFAGFISSAVAFLLALVLIIAPLSYKEFERSFIRQKELYENFEVKNDDYAYVVNILEANQDLIELQTRKEMYGFASMVPDSIMELEPIGFGGN